MNEGNIGASGRQGVRKRRTLLGLIVLASILLAGWALIAPLRLTLADPARLRTLIVGWGVWGVLALLGLQIAQVLLAPIPGQTLGLVGGYLYGPWLGTLINMIGTLVGSGVAMWLARRFGRPLVQRLVSPEVFEHLDRLATRRGPTAFFLIFLFPFLPDDAACFVAGLSPLPLGELLLLVLFGRLPGVFIPNWLGAHATELGAGQWVVIVLLMIPIAFGFWRWQDSIEGFLYKFLEKLPGRNRPVC